MMRNSIICLVCFMATGFLLKATEDFERSYTLIPGRHITIDNKIGDIKVTGYNGEEIKIFARKKGPDRDAIKIIDRNFGPKVELFSMFSEFNNSKTSVDFEVKVPKSNNTVSIELRSGSGKIEAADFSGSLVVHSFRGDVEIANVQGNVYVHSVSGHMDAKIKKSEGRRWMKFDSGSGNIKVTAPSDFEARIELRTTGNLKTEFPVDISQGRYGEHIARGQLGSGTQRIEISSVFGSVSLLKQ
jgi:hypothetical protein